MKKLVFIILLLAGVLESSANCGTGTVATPVLESVSVDLAGNIVICWAALPDPDLAFYEIFTIPAIGGNLIVATNELGLCYTIPAAMNNSDTEILEFGVGAIDTCGNASGNPNYHNTILLKDSFDVCASSVYLKWNAYDDFSSGTNVLYGVYLSVNSGPYALESATSSLATVFNGVVFGDTYDFYIEAIENGGMGPFSSTSNSVRANTSDAVRDPLFNYLYTVNVLDSSQISLNFFVDTAADVTQYAIKRALSLNGIYTTVGSIATFSGMNPAVSFTDLSDVDANNSSYFYKIDALDICGIEKTTSNIGRTVWLDAVSNPLEGINTLTITPYEGWDQVDYYEIFRSVGGTWETAPLAVIPAFTTASVYTDDITTISYGDGAFCYKVIAYQKNIPPYGNLPASSLSNAACALHEPILYVPNAFIPSGRFNTEFKPVLTFADPEAYLFRIYNKWGQVVFETKEVDQAWNGKFNNLGENCQKGIYVYLVKLLMPNENEFTKRGKLTLLR